MAFGIAAAAMQNNLGLACEIGLAHLLVDKLDGVMARATDTTSKIGAIRDEIADMYFTASIGISIGIFSGRLPPDLVVPGAIASALFLLPILASDVPDVIGKLNKLRKSNAKKSKSISK